MIRHIVTWKLRAQDAAAQAEAVAAIAEVLEPLEALDAYQVHPGHVAAAAVVRQHVTDRSSIDFEV